MGKLEETERLKRNFNRRFNKYIKKNKKEALKMQPDASKIRF